MTQRRHLLALGVSLLLAANAHAADRATPEEAKVMAINAAKYLKSVGPETAFAAFNAKTGPWHDREMYIGVQDSNGVMLANGDNPSLVGRSILDLKDIDGKPFMREKLEIKDTGWITYKWRNPVTKAVEKKTQYVIRVDGYVLAVGAYAP